jgi:hypothetical protein
VGDQHERHAVLALQAQEQVEDLRLNGHVERRRRLVGDQQARVAGDRHGDHDALVHAARELVRKGGEPAFGRRDADLLEQLDGAPAVLGPAAAQVHLERLGDLKAHGEAGVERGHGLLEDHRHVLAGDPPAFGRAEAEQVAAVEGQALGRHLGGPGQETHERQHGDALARSRLADDADQLALVQGQVDAVDRPERPARGRELDGQVVDLEQRHRVSSASAWGRARRATRRP